MKALVLHQPWAMLMAIGAKTIETRSWGTKHRGDIVICASRAEGKWPTESRFIRACAECFDGAGMPRNCDGNFDLLGGVALAAVRLDDCVQLLPKMRDSTPIPVDSQAPEREMLFGDFRYGRYAWVTSHLRRLPTPVPVLGRQGLFNLQDSEFAAIMDELCLPPREHQEGQRGEK